MAKRFMKLHVRIPEYRSPRNSWRRLIHAAVIEEQARCGIQYHADDRLEIEIHIYLGDRALGWNDVDNRLKDVLDALQGRAGGTKGIRTLSAVIPNDCQIYRVIIEKRPPPKQSLGYGHITVRRLRAMRA